MIKNVKEKNKMKYDKTITLKKSEWDVLNAFERLVLGEMRLEPDKLETLLFDIQSRESRSGDINIKYEDD